MILFDNPKKTKDNRYEIRFGNGCGFVVSLYVEEEKALKIRENPKVLDDLLKKYKKGD